MGNARQSIATLSRTKRRSAGLILAAAGLVTIAPAAFAIEKDYVGLNNGNFNSAGNWSSGGVPAIGNPGDDVVLGNTNPHNLSGNVTAVLNTSFSSGTAGFNSFTVNSSGLPSYMIVNETSGGNLYAVTETIGTNVSDNEFNQSGGSLNTTTNLTIGASSFANTYTLSGTNTSLTASLVNLGVTGGGVLMQSGGIVAVGNGLQPSMLALGVSSPGNGQYQLSGGALRADAIYVGVSGKGTFNQSGTGNSSFNDLEIGFNPGSTGAYVLSGTGTMTSGFSEFVGVNGAGTFNQTAGLNSISGSLFIADGSGSTGTYTLSGTGSLSVSFAEDIGYTGAGVFNQSGGLNSCFGLFLGINPNSTGTYILSGTGTLSAAGAVGIGQAGIGIFNQTGGVAVIQQGLHLGFGLGSTGTFNLSGTGSISVATDEYIGDNELGIFNQSGGVNSAADLRISSSAASGMYMLSGGTASVSGNAYVGAVGTLATTASLTVSAGGILNIAGTLIAVPTAGTTVNLSGGTINAGALDFSGTAALLNWSTGTLNLTASNLTLGAGGKIGPTLSLTHGQTFGLPDPGGTLTVAASGSLNLSGGDVVIGAGGLLSATPSVFLDSGSTIFLSGGAMTDSAEEVVGVNTTGVFNQSGGTNTVGIDLVVGSAQGSIGGYFLSATGTLSSANEHIGEIGTGVFNQSGGANIAGAVFLGPQGSFAQSSGTLQCATFTETGGSAAFVNMNVDGAGIGAYSLSGGNLTASLTTVGNNGAGSFNQSGGSNAINSNLVLGLGALSTGTYTLSAGTLTAAGEIVGVLGSGTFNQTGGTNNAGASLVLGNFSGSSGSYAISGGTLNAPAVFVGGTIPSAGATGLLTVSNTGRLSDTGTLQVSSGGRVNLDVPNTAIGNLTVVGNGIVNLNGTLAINYASPANDPVSTVASYLQSGYNGGTWTGTAGIISTSITGGSPTLALGYADGNIDFGTPAGPNQIVIQYTLAGDANLDGLVNFNDLVAVIQNFNKAGADWAHGDFHYGTSTNFNDLVTVVQNFNKTLPPPSGSAIELGGTTIPIVSGTDVELPEPGILAVIGTMAVGLILRRRRSHND